MAAIIERKDRFAVEFDKAGRVYRTLFTSYRSEATAWLASIETSGWTVSGRPLPIA